MRTQMSRGELHKSRNLMRTEMGTCCVIVFFSTTTNCDIMACRSFQFVEYSVRCLTSVKNETELLELCSNNSSRAKNPETKRTHVRSATSHCSNISGKVCRDKTGQIAMMKLLCATQHETARINHAVRPCSPHQQVKISLISPPRQDMSNVRLQ